MDDNITETVEKTDSTDILDIETALKRIKIDRDCHPSAVKPKHFIKLQLTETDDITLFEAVNLTVPKGTEEAAAVEKYNADYEYLKQGAGRNRRTSDAESQTETVLVKSRSSNTDRIKTGEKDSFVSNFEMFDTYAELEQKTKELELDDDEHRKMKITTYTKKGMEDTDEKLSKSENFRLSSMILQRLLAGNIFHEHQKRFRSMTLPDPLELNIKYLYRLEKLWAYKSSETTGMNVVDMCWCQNNSDLLAVAYGNFNYRDNKRSIFGKVLIWSIKNPVNPERQYKYDVPVTAVAFSEMKPQLMAVALYNGTVEVIDVADIHPNKEHSIVAKSERKSSPGFEPIWQIQWIQANNFEYIMAASQDGRITKYKISTGPYLVGYLQLHLHRVEGTVEALDIEHKKTFIEAYRHPQILCLQKHPQNIETYLVGTDEGCLHVCSTNFPYQHLSVLQVHKSGVHSIDYSPYSPKIFLTAGNDWTIRIWIESIFEPIIELSDGFNPIYNAYWSPIHSTIIASCTQDAVQFWDLRRKNKKPASIRTFEGKKLTVIKFSPCGRSLIIGDTEGNTHIYGLEDFPFAPHYQYDELQKALCHSLTNKHNLEKSVKQLGFLGYPSPTKKF
ncbi:CLUMA_CG009021, isoform A [Clunio marinus]|uniref:Dynein axonemal intermediate chain 4 n=1 Tax=Clunio marinus TaxID=568069 RepID=A0A1J1I5I4_9DIPT|nr:CLUMA_CG009021, isoform A [Clunio marinus]